MNDIQTSISKLKAAVQQLTQNEKIEFSATIRRLIEGIEGSPPYPPPSTVSPRFRAALDHLNEAQRQWLDGFREVRTLLENSN